VQRFVLLGLVAIAMLAACATPAPDDPPGAAPSEARDAAAREPTEDPAAELPPATAGPIRADLALASTTVPLGETIEATLTLTNASTGTVRIQELVHDVQSLSFRMVQGGTSFEYRRIMHWSHSPRIWEVVDLEPGDSVSEAFRIPAVVPGEVRLAGVYRGAGDEEVGTAPATVRVDAPSPDARVVTRLRTNFGDVVIDLYEHDAPNTVLHFADLVSREFYDGVRFHRLIPGFVLQGGDPLGNGTGDAGYYLPAEFNERPHAASVVSMARGPEPDSAGSQFFICLAPAPHLDGEYTAFGEVVEGFESAVRKIEAEVETYEGSDRIAGDAYIERATLEVRPRSDAP